METNIIATVPEDWQVVFADPEDNFLYLQDEDGYQKVLTVVRYNDGGSLEEIHQELVETSLPEYVSLDQNQTTMNGNETYYTLADLENGNYSALYTMRYQDYIVILLDYETEYYDFYSYRTLLESIRNTN